MNSNITNRNAFTAIYAGGGLSQAISLPSAAGSKGGGSGAVPMWLGDTPIINAARTQNNICRNQPDQLQLLLSLLLIAVVL
jgi:hypothetical protein